jgi:hypothetical protein
VPIVIGRSRQLVLGAPDVAAVEINTGVVRAELDLFVVVGDGVIVVAFPVIGIAARRVNRGAAIRAQLQHLAVVRDGAVVDAEF